MGCYYCPLWLAAISGHQQADKFSIALSVLGIRRKAIPFNSMSSLSGDVLEHGFPIIISYRAGHAPT